ncbi:hypothetical protein NPIL_78211 [Nephila pilipes]|uniref:Uncharacterized protein n=1 Tax=Nephila pilipes TaxID=299642 RepID=A0A8X6JBH9_NEPPI|nr:hypothetical protein NPIL_78211 [Nephila pilipes]
MGDNSSCDKDSFVADSASRQSSEETPGTCSISEARLGEAHPLREMSINERITKKMNVFPERLFTFCDTSKFE